MKKQFFLLMVAMMGLISVSFTSCDDEEIAKTLEGTWKGDMYVTSEWEGKYYEAIYTEITFLKDPYAFSSGTGYWVDYYSDAPWDYVANHIDWRVDLGDIHVKFIEEGPLFRLAIIAWTTTDSRAISTIMEIKSHFTFITSAGRITQVIIGDMIPEALPERIQIA